MNIKAISSQSFYGKNTFLQKSKNAYNSAKQTLKKEGLTPLAKSKAAELEKMGAYYKSLHLEAEARLDNIKSEKEFAKLQEFGTLEKAPEDLKILKILIKGYWYKINSAMTLGDAYGAFPERFKDVDNIENYPPRNYKF